MSLILTGQEKFKDSGGNETMAVDKSKALETALGQIEKQFGKGAVMRLGQNEAMHVDAIPTGSLSLDLALGIGGLPRGRIVEIYGPESSGKTTLALHCIAEGQKSGGYAAFIDVEHALDPVYARALGVDVDSLLVSQPDTGEQALEITEALVRSGAIDVIVVDSVAALVPRAEIEGEVGDSHVRPSGPAHEPGPEKAGRSDLQIQLCGHFYQPAERKGRSHVRQPGGDSRRPGAEVLFLRANRYPQDRNPESGRRDDRLPYQGKGGKE